MKNIIKNFIFLLFFTVFLIGCSTVERLYLQDVEVTGPINQSPIHISDSTDTPSVSFSMRFAYNPQKEVKAKTEGTPMVNSQGFYQVDTIYHNDGTISYEKTPGVNNYPYKGQNLTWSFANVTAGLDIDFKVSRNFALFAGVSYASGNDKSLWGGSGGIGLFGVKNGMAYRLDVGLHIQSISYDASTIAEVKTTALWGPSYDYVMFYHDIDQETYFDPFINFTFNTAKHNWLLNIFINGGYSVQSLLDFQPQTVDYDWFFLPPFVFNETITNDYRGETSAGFVHFTPGIYFNFNEYSRLLIGVRVFLETRLNKSTENLFILPMMQVDFTL
ncbi:MAG: hypothetical protein ROY99_06360 [Ignavibacterium sp.]|jgi:hypothetical protein|nr:hypothetical protein [Ignavibacterium sp.]